MKCTTVVCMWLTRAPGRQQSCCVRAILVGALIALGCSPPANTKWLGNNVSCTINSAFCGPDVLAVTICCHDARITSRQCHCQCPCAPESWPNSLPQPQSAQ